MTPKPGRTETIFAAAIGIASDAARRRYVEQACAGDARLKGKVEALVADHFRAGSFLEPPAGLPQTREQPAPALPGEAAGTVIGNYKLLQQIGEGGMGTVFMAAQSRPVQRTVALKIIKRGMDSRQVIARFEAERQALAVMDHPNIAKVLDAGTTEHGRPYFVMELVKGVPITAYCDEHRLTPRERLELFVPVCQAVQHAHQKGIIHRDFKPSNVMVCLYDGQPVPKVIDFGVAKAAGPRLTERTLFTAFGSVVGTLEYMSPEQAELNQLDVDTRSDVYSLGVLLYELLTGTTPLERSRFETAAFLEVLRLIREEEPPRPSTRLSTSKGLPSIAANRGVEPRRLSGVVRGELDWIVMKALEKDRTRRYETASGLAADVRRHLDDEAVLACPPSGRYRLQKFVRRNRGAVLAGGAVVLALVAGIAGTTWGLLRAEGARAAADKSRLAESERAAGERQAKESAQKRLGQIEKGYEILGSIFADLDPNAADKEGKPLRALLGERLDRATRELEGEAVGDPLAVAKLQLTLARSHRGLGFELKAAELAARAFGTFDRAFGPQAPETLAALRVLASALMATKAFDRALPLYDDLLKREKARLGPRDEFTLRTMEERAIAYLGAWKIELAVPMVMEVAKLRAAVYGPETSLPLPVVAAMARSYYGLEAYEKAIPLFESALQLQEAQFGADALSTLELAAELGAAYGNVRKAEQAIPLLERAFKLQRTKLGPDDARALLSMNNLGAVYQQAGKHDKALPLLQQKLASQERLLGPDNIETIRTVCEVGVMAWQLKLPEKAIPLFERAVAHLEVEPGRDAPPTLVQRLNLGMNYNAAGRSKEALPHLEEVLARGTKLKPFPVELDKLQSHLAFAYDATGDFERAHALLTAMLARALGQFGPENRETTSLQAQVGQNLLKRRKYDDAIAALRVALKAREEHEPDEWSTFNTRSLLGAAFLGKGRLDDAEPLLLDGYNGMKARVHQMTNGMARRLRVPEAIERLAQLYDARGKPDEAAKWRAESAAYTRALDADTARKRAEHE